MAMTGTARKRTLRGGKTEMIVNLKGVGSVRVTGPAAFCEQVVGAVGSIAGVEVRYEQPVVIAGQMSLADYGIA